MFIFFDAHVIVSPAAVKMYPVTEVKSSYDAKLASENPIIVGWVSFSLAG